MQPDTSSEVISVGGRNGRLKAEGTETAAQTSISHQQNVLTFQLKRCTFFFFNRFPACEIYGKGSKPDSVSQQGSRL